MLPNLVGTERSAAVALFLLVFISHSLSPNATSGDSRWIVPQMVSLLSEGNTDLNEYPELLRSSRYYAIDCVDAEFRITSPDPVRGCPDTSRYYGHYPFGSAVVALPPMVAMDAALRMVGPPLLSAWSNRLTPVVRGFLSRDYVRTNALVEMVLASFLMGTATVFIFLTGRDFLSRRMAVLLALLFAYGTAAWSTGSRALWQHGPEMLMLAIAQYLLVRGHKRPPLVPWSAVPLAFAYFIRPTGGIAVAVLGIFVFLHHRDRFRNWALTAAITAAPFVAYNFALYRRFLQPYFTEQSFLEPSLRNAGGFLSAMAGQCISPSRGLFVFSPFLLFAVPGIRTALRRNRQNPLSHYLAAILLLHWIAISAFADWTAGACYGPRYFSDVTPIFVFFLIPLLESFEARRARRTTMAVFAVAALVAFGIHFRGAVNWDVQRWNDPGVNPSRVWDWRDPQFLHGWRVSRDAPTSDCKPAAGAPFKEQGISPNSRLLG